MFAFVFGWNNSGLTTGNLSNLVTYNLALCVSIAGVFIGFFVAGQSMSGSILGKLVSRSLPTTGLFSAILISTIVLFLLTILKLPVSLSNCTVGAFVGVALATGTAVKASSLIEIVGSWLIVPFVCAILSFLIYGLAVNLEKSRSLASIVRANRIFLVIVVFFLSFMLGANNLGLIQSFAVVGTHNPVVLALFELFIFGFAALGVILFGRTMAQVISEKIVGLSQIKTFAAVLAAAIVILVLTISSIPVSLTQVIIGGMVGAGVSRRPWSVNSREIGELITGWALITIISAGLAFLLTRAV